MTPAEVNEFLRMVSGMRRAQREYFRTRSAGALAESKDMERRVDAALLAIANPPRPDLFADAKE